MFGQFISLYKARKDSTLAKRLASEMVIDGAIGRVSWPLAIAKFWMTVGIIGLAVLILLFLALGSAAHWTVAIPALPLAGLLYGIVRLWRGINAGVEHVTQLAKTKIGNRAAALSFQSNRPTETPNIEN